MTFDKHLKTSMIKLLNQLLNKRNVLNNQRNASPREKTIIERKIRAMKNHIFHYKKEKRKKETQTTFMINEGASTSKMPQENEQPSQSHYGVIKFASKNDGNQESTDDSDNEKDNWWIEESNTPCGSPSWSHQPDSDDSSIQTRNSIIITRSQTQEVMEIQQIIEDPNPLELPSSDEEEGNEQINFETIYLSSDEEYEEIKRYYNIKRCTINIPKSNNKQFSKKD